MLERDYQARLIRKLRRMFKDCVVIKNDTEYMPGIPDLTVLYGPKWGMLETKASGTASMRPNQVFYIDMFNEMSFAAIIHPENEAEVLRALQHAFEFGGDSRVS